MTKTLLLFSAFVLTANAGDFASAKASADSIGNLVVSWRETGLSQGLQYTYRAEAKAKAAYWCLEAGVRHPAGLALDSVTSDRESTFYFSASNSGTVSGELVLSPPPPDPAAPCPQGYRRVLHDVTYWDIALENTTEPNSVDIPGEYNVLMFGRAVGAGKHLPTY
jgi:hypothetical protein